MLGNKYREVIKNVENNILNPKDCEYIKNQITELTMTYMSELEILEKNYDSKITECFNKINSLENAINEIENEKPKDEDYKTEKLDIEPIVCPYCNSKFLIENNKQREVKCPNCKNILELDWEDVEDDM